MAKGSHSLLSVLFMGIIFVGLGMSSQCSPMNLPVSEEKRPMTEVFAKADWYLERPEAEMEWRGLLQENDIPVGPNTRTALIYILITDNKHIPVYAANVERKLAQYVGHLVIARGKLVDLTNEGYGQELWIASIQRADLTSK